MTDVTVKLELSLSETLADAVKTLGKAYSVSGKELQEERARSRATIDAQARFLHEERADKRLLRQALEQVRLAILNEPMDGAIRDTFYMPDDVYMGGTVVDYITNALGDETPEQKPRPSRVGTITVDHIDPEHLKMALFGEGEKIPPIPNSVTLSFWEAIEKGGECDITDDNGNVLGRVGKIHHLSKPDKPFGEPEKTTEPEEPEEQEREWTGRFRVSKRAFMGTIRVGDDFEGVYSLDPSAKFGRGERETLKVTRIQGNKIYFKHYGPGILAGEVWQPEEQFRDGYRLVKGSYGDLGTPGDNHFDASKRGFDPK